MALSTESTPDNEVFARNGANIDVSDESRHVALLFFAVFGGSNIGKIKIEASQKSP
jgi:hypothetical protein